MAEIKYLDLAGLKALYGVVDTKITTAKNELVGGAKTYTTLKAIEDKLNTMFGEGDESVQSLIDSLRSELKGDVSTKYDTLKKIEDALEVINGDDEGSIKKQVSDAIANVVNGAPEAFDTLKEIADWISNDETGTAALVDRVAANETAIETLNGADTVTGSVAKSIKDAVNNLDATVNGKSADEHVTVQVVEADGKLTGVTVTTSDIASAQGLADEVSRATAAEAKALTDAKAYTDTEIGKVNTSLTDGLALKVDKADTKIIETEGANPKVMIQGVTLSFVPFTSDEIQSAQNA